jgi:hypothetical protein
MNYAWPSPSFSLAFFQDSPTDEGQRADDRGEGLVRLTDQGAGVMKYGPDACSSAIHVPPWQRTSTSPAYPP